ncbi:MAG: sugar ABC transporter permease, partial [Candidatus Omnitrophica bacterium]|nr:sugar ABC transporter permease [Candidatus Omnitrophota bacterium]
QTRLLIILTVIGSLQDFQSILVLTRGGPGSSSMVPALWMYFAAFEFGRFGYGAAIGFTLFITILALTLINLRFLKKTEVQS